MTDNLFSGIENSPIAETNKFGKIFSDGGSRGNPGNAGCGFVIYGKDNKEITRGGENCGHQTNNFAEYRSMMLALEKCVELGISEVEMYMDSKLVVEQMKGNWKVKNANLKPLFEKAVILKEQIPSLKFFHIPREKNKVADSIANEFMDRG